MSDPNRPSRSRGSSVLILAIAIVLASVSGCKEPKEAPTVKEQLSPYAELEGLSQSSLPELADEYARLRAERSTIVDMLGQHRPRNEKQDLNRIFKQHFPDAVFQQQLTQRLAPFGIEELTRFDSVSMGNLRPIVKDAESKRTLLIRAMQVNGSKFWVDYAQGLGADTSFVEQAEVLFQLESARCALAASDNEPGVFLDSMRNLHLITRKLSDVWHVIPRLRAIDLRANSVLLLQAYVNRPFCERETQVALRDLCLNELGHWASESQCWIGDRTIGMHAYEMVRDGYYLSLLPEEETDFLAEKKMQFATAKMVQEHLDEDEAFYLRTMRRLIAVSKSPYYKRGEFAEEMQTEINKLRESETYPWIAQEILLDSIIPAQRRLAEDRALLEACVMVLSHSTGERVPEFKNDPVSGYMYEVESLNGTCAVHGLKARGETISLRLPIRKPENSVAGG